MNGLTPVELVRPSLLQRLFRRRPAQNAYREVQNVIAARPINTLSTDSVSFN